jgi:hypothetical protein
MFLEWLKDTYQPYIASHAGEGEENMVVMDAAAFHKTPHILKFLHEQSWQSGGQPTGG